MGFTNAGYLLFSVPPVCFNYFILKGKGEEAHWRTKSLREGQGGSGRDDL